MKSVNAFKEKVVQSLQANLVASISMGILTLFLGFFAGIATTSRDIVNIPSKLSAVEQQVELINEYIKEQREFNRDQLEINRSQESINKNVEKFTDETKQDIKSLLLKS